MEEETQHDCTLNITSPNDKFVKHDKHKSSNVVRWFFYPKEGVRLTRVCDFNGLIYTTKNHVPSANLLFKDDKPYLLNVDLNNGLTKVFLKLYGKWTRISVEDYMYYENYLYVSSNPDKHITLDVNKRRDDEHLIINKCNHRKKNEVKYKPNVGYYARAVVDGDTTIWKPENNAERCLSARVYYNQLQKNFIKLRIRVIGSIQTRYYQRVNGKWDEVDEDTFIDAEYSELPEESDDMLEETRSCHSSDYD